MSLKKLRVSINDFDVKGIIRQGHFGEIQVARERGTENVYALKILHKADVLSQQNVSFYDEERNITARANSQWITQLHYAFQDQHNLYLAMDFHPGGDLLSLWSVRPALSVDNARMLAHAFIASRVDYCNSILYQTAVVHLRPLQLVLNAAVCLIVKKRKWDSITPTIRDNLHRLLVRQRVEFKICTSC